MRTFARMTSGRKPRSRRSSAPWPSPATATWKPSHSRNWASVPRRALSSSMTRMEQAGATSSLLHHAPPPDAGSSSQPSWGPHPGTGQSGQGTGGGAAQTWSNGGVSPLAAPLVAAIALLVSAHLAAERRGLEATRAVTKLAASAGFVLLGLSSGRRGPFEVAVLAGLVLSAAG